MIEFLWDLHQEKGISEAKSDASSAKDEVSRHNDRVRELEFSLHRMALASQAMWELLRTRLGVTEEELLATMKEIDLRDGKLDGRMSAQVTKCPQCQRTVGNRHARCIYCGTTVSKPHVFQ